MKLRIKSLILVMLMTVSAVSAQILPTFSTEESPVWYYVQFHTGSHTMADRGSGNKITTADKSATDAQMWQLIGTQEKFILRSKLGNYVGFESSRFTTTSSKSSATDLTLSASTASGAGECWEIGRVGQSGHMNQFGGTGLGAQLGEWTAGDPNNPVKFLAGSSVLPTFSTADGTPVWYFITFANSGYSIRDNGSGKAATQAVAEPSDEQLWKLVGTQEKFQLINKAGRYARVTGSGDNARLTTGSTAYSSGFSLIETGNSTYSPNWEIKANSISTGKDRFNQWEGTEIGHPIGFWSANDVNNPLVFVPEKDMRYPDYKVTGSTTYRPESKLSLWYTVPATLTAVGNIWMEYSLPLGNGQLGASMFNGVSRDQILMNEKTLWSGRSTDNGGSYGDYLNFGSLFVDMLDEAGFGYTNETAAGNYYRTLDLSTATGESGFTSPDGSVSFKRQYIVSYPDGVVAVRISASKPGKIFQKYTLESGKPGIVATTSYSEGEGTYAGKLQTIAYNARIKVVPTGGEMTTSADGITVKGADEVLVIMKGATDFDPYQANYVSGVSADALATAVDNAVDAAAAKGWQQLLADHVADYQNYFNRVTFSIDGTANTTPTNQLVDRYSSSSDPADKMLEELYFHYGRYLEIASSRGVDLPSNLQGIWNNSSSAPWHADIHANINVQMNYWPAESTNLSELHLPFLNYIHNMAVNHTEWQKYAKDSGQTKGWTCYTENNIFGGVGSFMHNYVIANAWYCTHLWQHYRYTLDKEFLQRVFPTMWSASEYWIERLKLDTDGTYVAPREYSPEQGPTEDGVAHAQQLIYDLFANTIKAIDVLGDDAGAKTSDIEILRDRFNKLDKGLSTETYTGNWGTDRGVKSGDLLLREWKTSSYTSGELNHRHMSHLMAVYPFSQITPESEFYAPAVNSMKLRGDASTGWSMGWKANLWARLLNGDRAHGILKTALRHSTSYGTNQGAGGIYYNLFDSHSPFQIDGNFGSCAGIAEMLLQSQNDELHILPALPSAWPSGSVTGLKAVGDFTVDIKWAEGKALKATIVSNQGQPLVIKNTDIAKATVTVNGTETTPKTLAADKIQVNATAGDKVEILFNNPSAITDITADNRETILSVSNRTITILNSTPESVRVYDLSGREILATSSAVFTIPESAGHNVVLNIVTESGNISAHKLSLR